MLKIYFLLFYFRMKFKKFIWRLKFRKKYRKVLKIDHVIKFDPNPLGTPNFFYNFCFPFSFIFPHIFFPLSRHTPIPLSHSYLSPFPIPAWHSPLPEPAPPLNSASPVREALERAVRASQRRASIFAHQPLRKLSVPPPAPLSCALQLSRTNQSGVLLYATSRLFAPL